MSEHMAELEKKWKMQYDKLLEFKRKNGHCLVPRRYKQDTAFGSWVNTQRVFHTKNTIRLDRKELLDAIGFDWKGDRIAARVSGEDKKWHLQYEKLVDFKRLKGHCKVPSNYEQDKAFGQWVHHQRKVHIRKKMRLDRKEHLDKVGFVWKVASVLTVRSSATNDVSSFLVISSRLGQIFVSLSFFSHA
jgi:hypothetical protein